MSAVEITVGQLKYVYEMHSNVHCRNAVVFFPFFFLMEYICSFTPDANYTTNSIAEKEHQQKSNKQTNTVPFTLTPHTDDSVHI